MEQRARTHADLNAMLIGQKTVPKGCRVLNVSPQGMLLQCEADGRLLTFREGDHVDVHLTVQHESNRKKFAIPAVVNRVDIKRIDVVFQHPNSDLLKLIEAYRISDAHMMEASIALSKQDAGANISSLPKQATKPTIEPDENKPARPRTGRLVNSVLATVIICVGLGAGTYLYTSGIDSRLSVLETITINQTNELAEMRSRIFSASLQEGRYASLNARLQALTDAFGTLEDKLGTIIPNQPLAAKLPAGTAETKQVVALGRETPISITTGPETQGTAPSSKEEKHQAAATLQESGSNSVPAVDAQNTGNTENQVIRTAAPTMNSVVNPGLAATETNTTATTAVSDTKKIDNNNSNTRDLAITDTSVHDKTADRNSTGPWIINLLSSRNKKDTDRLAETAMAQGIPVVQSRAILKDKEYWRLQVAGFRNADEAKDFAIPVKQKLGIKDVWIFKQK